MIVTRLRLADRETMAIETLHVREALVPGLSADDLERHSFYELLHGTYGVEIVGGTQTIEPTVTNEDESQALGVPLHSPAFVFERVTRSPAGEIVEYVRSIYRGDRYRIVTELSRPREPRPGAAPARERCRRPVRRAVVSTKDELHPNGSVEAEPLCLRASRHAT